MEKYNYVDFYKLPKVCQQALVTEFFFEKGISFGLDTFEIDEWMYWLCTEEIYGYGKRNYIYLPAIRGIDRTIKIANLIYNKKYNTR